MKNKIVLAIALVLLILTGCNKNDSLPATEDGIKIKEEYEKLNGTETKSGKKYVDVNLPKNNRFIYATAEDIVKMLENNEAGMIYFGFPECPWCRNMMDVLDEAAKTNGFDKIYYVNVLELRNELKLNDDKKIETVKEGDPNYNKLVTLLDKSLPSYPGLEDESIKRILVPLVIGLNNGEVVAEHLNTLESQTDAYVPLSKEQRKELLDIYDKMFKTLDACPVGPDSKGC